MARMHTNLQLSDANRRFRRWAIATLDAAGLDGPEARP